MDAILNYRPEGGEDYYALLGCDELSSTEPYYVCSPGCPGTNYVDQAALALTDISLLVPHRLSKSWQNLRSELWNVTLTSIRKTPKLSMHWAIRSKKDLMLEGTDLTCADTVLNKEQNEQRETKTGGPALTTEEMRQKQSGSPEKAISPQNPGSPGLSDLNCGRLRFRWSGDAPSELLRKFRNYEI
ncbi:hypothetical protein STEG23_000893 [Scotinomys teguina]